MNTLNIISCCHQNWSLVGERREHGCGGRRARLLIPASLLMNCECGWTVAQWSAWKLWVWCPASAWVYSSYCNFPPQSENVNITLTADSKLPLGVSGWCVWGVFLPLSQWLMEQTPAPPSPRLTVNRRWSARMSAQYLKNANNWGTGDGNCHIIFHNDKKRMNIVFPKWDK